MQVILLQDVKGVGTEGSVTKVKEGYARNYLIPRKLAMPYNDGAARIFEEKKIKAAREAEKHKKNAEKLAKTIAQMSLTIPVESGVGDVLFGSVTSEMIFNALGQEGVTVDKKNIILEEPIRKLGIYNVEIKLHPEIKEVLRVWVVKK
ncbi:MAG: 50S ribosomal protein L9 [Candidatus Omnitrophica bacterium]|nr:50S ribosomal protein L9 [Candidatus Omnitrophota bacterium]